MLQYDLEAEMRGELCIIASDLHAQGEFVLSRRVQDSNWTKMIRDYPDLTAEEIASAVCGGVS